MAKGKTKKQDYPKPTNHVPCRWCGYPTPNWASGACDDCAALYDLIAKNYAVALKMIQGFKK